MEIRQLEYFLMVSELSSFTRAAEQLHVSQPGVTSAIRSLEEELGILLFDRSQKQVVLTTEGTVFLKHVKNVMKDISLTIAGVNEMKNLARGRVRVGVPPIIGASIFPPMWLQFKNSYPTLELVLVEEGSLAIQKLLENGDIDLGIVINLRESTMLDITPITTQELVGCFSISNDLKRKKYISLYDLSDEQFVFPKDDCMMRSVLMERFRSEGIYPKIALETSHIQTLIGIVTCGGGISIVPREVIKDHTTLLGISFEPKWLIEVGLARKKNRHLSHAAQALFNFFKDTVTN